MLSYPGYAIFTTLADGIISLLSSQCIPHVHVSVDVFSHTQAWRPSIIGSSFAGHLHWFPPTSGWVSGVIPGVVVTFLVVFIFVVVGLLVVVDVSLFVKLILSWVGRTWPGDGPFDSSNEIEFLDFLHDLTFPDHFIWPFFSLQVTTFLDEA